MQRWGAACRFCARKGWTVQEHKDYLAKLEEENSEKATAPKLGPAAKAAMEIVMRGEELGEEDLRKLALERVESAASTVKVDGPGTVDQVEKLQCPFPSCKRVFILRGKLGTHVMRVHRDLLVNELMAHANKMQRGASDSDSTRGRKRRGASNNETRTAAQPKREKNKDDKLQGFRKNSYDAKVPMQSHEHHLGYTLDNLVRWNDSSRTRLGLMPLQPPQGSRSFETGPHRIFRLAISEGKLSRKWNAVLDDDEETVFGVTNAELCAQHAPQLGMGRRQRAKRGQSRRKRSKHQGNDDTDGGQADEAPDTDDEPGDAFTTGLEDIRLLRPPPRQAFCCKLSMAGRNQLIRAGPRRDCLFSFTDEKLERLAPRRLLPEPEDPPQPPSRADLDETAWVSEAARLVDAAVALARRREGLSEDQDPFEKMGLKPLSASAKEEDRGQDSKKRKTTKTETSASTAGEESVSQAGDEKLLAMEPKTSLLDAARIVALERQQEEAAKH